MLLAGKMMKKMGETVRYSGNKLYYRYIRNLLIFGLFAITDRSTANKPSTEKLVVKKIHHLSDTNPVPTQVCMLNGNEV